MRCNVIGAGRLGKSLIFALKKFKIITLASVCNRNKHHALDITQKLNEGEATDSLDTLLPADITFITTPDDMLPSVVQILSEKKILLKNSMVVHCSGALDSRVLAPLQDIGCAIASIHPAKSFIESQLDENSFDKVFCVLEGDEPATTWLRNAFETMGAEVIEINPENKGLYHTACTMASNYLVTLFACSTALIHTTNIPEKKAKQLVQNLMLGTLENLIHSQQAKDALTGPLMRGDIETLSRHIHDLKSFPIYEKLYRAAGLASLDLTSLTHENQDVIKKMFEI